MRKFAADLWVGVRTGPARAGLAFFSLALGLFAVTILLATLEALRGQARELVESFGAGSVVYRITDFLGGGSSGICLNYAGQASFL